MVSLKSIALSRTQNLKPFSGRNYAQNVISEAVHNNVADTGRGWGGDSISPRPKAWELRLQNELRRQYDAVMSHEMIEENNYLQQSLNVFWRLG